MTSKCNCGKSIPCFNYEGLQPVCCSQCKQEGMINVKSKKCYCGKSQPNFNYEGLKPEFCSKCKEEGMIDVRSKSKKCYCGKSQPSFNYEGLKPEYCSKCKEEGMINVNKKRNFIEILEEGYINSPSKTVKTEEEILDSGIISSVKVESSDEWLVIKLIL